MRQDSLNHRRIFWRDPEFDRSQHAFYYARILEIPTPRWTTYDAARYDIEIPAEVPHSIQERAYTSPVWYTPDPELVVQGERKAREGAE